MIVLDTTVLVYAVGSEHKFREPCRTLIRAIGNGDMVASTTVEAIQEFAHVRARRRDRDDAAKLANDYVELLSPLLLVSEDDLKQGLRIFTKYDRLGSFDAVLAAAAIAARADAMVSADSAFSQLTSLTHVVPDAEGIHSLLG